MKFVLLWLVLGLLDGCGAHRHIDPRNGAGNSSPESPRDFSGVAGNDLQKLSQASVMHLGPDEEGYSLGMRQKFKQAAAAPGYISLPLDQLADCDLAKAATLQNSRLSKDILLISGSHGSFNALFSVAYNREYLRTRVVTPLERAGFRFRVIIIESCESAGLIPVFRSLLMNDGLMIGHITAATDALYTRTILDATIPGNPVTADMIADSFRAKIVELPYRDYILDNDLNNGPLLTPYLVNQGQTEVERQFIRQVHELYINVRHMTGELKKILDKDQETGEIFRKKTEEMLLHSMLADDLSQELSALRALSRPVGVESLVTFLERQLLSGLEKRLDDILDRLRDHVKLSMQMIYSEKHKTGFFHSDIPGLGAGIPVLDSDFKSCLKRVTDRLGDYGLHYRSLDYFYDEGYRMIASGEF